MCQTMDRIGVATRQEESGSQVFILNLWYVVLVCHQYEVCEEMLTVCMLVGMESERKRTLCFP